MRSYTEIDEYIAGFPEPTQAILNKVRDTIKSVVPDAQEKISYGIPTFWQGKNIIHFGGYPNHIGLYPGSKAVAELATLFKGYETSKGTVKFPIDKPIPYDLIKTVTEFCIQNTPKK